MKMTPAGLEPAIPGSVGRCLIHWATGPDEAFRIISIDSLANSCYGPRLCTGAWGRRARTPSFNECQRAMLLDTWRRVRATLLPCVAARCAPADTWPVGLMDKASASGAGDSRFESWAGHLSFACLEATARKKKTCIGKRQRGDSNPCGQSPMDF